MAAVTDVYLSGDGDAERPPVESAHVELVGRGRGPSRRASIAVTRQRGTVVVTVHGDLDLSRADHLGHILADLIDGQGNLSLVVDLHDASATDADCLSVFTEAAERARRRGGTMELREPPAPLHHALQLRGLDEFVGTLLDDGPA